MHNLRIEFSREGEVMLAMLNTEERRHGRSETKLWNTYSRQLGELLLKEIKTEDEGSQSILLVAHER